ncbi:heterocycloanthracin/sonorensin family bacteriocin [Paenibacillus hemerocallicola]|uniref:Heterocycloanthracin/sonorensin family bacteriocin n=1 Tax=Paenibacillus hemerocallicola TaxID=1172614 RepID=A0A5C4T9X4_9BACL|nr:heterocycloanthracin/sonorensin family bacteriocin [Paenibacillus hemerocallicola]
MSEFKNELEQLSVSQFQAGQMTPWNQQSQYQAAAQYPVGQNVTDPSRLCVGFGGFCAGFCAGFCGGFCAGFCGGFCQHQCGGFCHHQCGGFCHHHCGR